MRDGQFGCLHFFTIFGPWPPQIGSGLIKDKSAAMSFPTRIAYVLGWRHLSFTTWISVSHGIVSPMGYNMEPDVFLGFPVSYFVFARTVHGYMRTSRRPLPVESAGEESPDFRFVGIAGESFLKGADSAIVRTRRPRRSTW